MDDGWGEGVTGYPRGFQKLFWWVAGLVLLTGLLLVPGVLDTKLDIPVPWHLDGDQRLWVAAGHLLVTLAIVGISGALWAVHMLRGWRMKRNRLTGVLMVSLLIVLVLSAVGIYYLGDEIASKWASLVHTGLGLIIGLIIWLHVLIGRAPKKRAP